MDLWGFDLVARKWSQYGDPSLSQDDYISSDDVPSDEDGAVAVIEQPASRGSESTFSVSNTYTGSDNNKWWVGVAGDLPAARYQHGLSVWRGTSGTERPFLVCFGGERSDTPWQLQGTGRGNLRATPAMEGAVGGAADQTAIDDDSFSGSGGGGTDNDNGGILGPVSSHAQSNDLWILPLPTGDAVSPFYEDKDEDGEGQISSYTSSNEDANTALYYGSDNGDRILSGGGDSGTRGGKGKGNIKGDNPHRRPIHHGNSNNTHSNGTIPISSNNSTAEGNKTDSVDERRNGWTLLSAGGCHYLDDGSQSDRSVDISALAIVGSFALAAFAGLLGYQLLKLFLTPKPALSTLRTDTTDTPDRREIFQLSTVLRYIPAKILPISLVARLRGYTDIIDDSTHGPGSLDTAGSVSVSASAVSKSLESEVSFEQTNESALELRESRK